MRNSHDASGSLEVSFVAMVQKTKSVVSLPIIGVPHRVGFKHTGAILARSSGRAIFSAAERYLEVNLREINRLDSIILDDKQVTDALLALYPSSMKSPRADGLAIYARVSIHDTFLNCEYGTAYDLWHSVCSFLDHSKMISKRSNPKQDRMYSALWGFRARKRDRLGKIMLQMFGLGNSENLPSYP